MQTLTTTRSWAVSLAVLLVTAGPAAAADLMVEARNLYNAGKYDAAIELAARIKAGGQQVDGANLVLARSYLERYRQSADGADLDAARAALNEVRPTALAPRERVELVIGLAESLYLEEDFGAAAEMFGAALARAGDVGPQAAERVLDWWASALERRAQAQAGGVRTALYQRILDRMERELEADPASAVASYWLAAAARGAGDLDRAWSAAAAAWIRAPLMASRAANLRGDLDRLVVQGIVPERARQLAADEPRRAEFAEDLQRQWDALKKRWR